MSDINRLPRGLLSILDQQVQGNYPTNLLEEVRPVIDIMDLYFQGRGSELVNDLSVAVAPGSLPVIAPPNGEMWAVHLASLIITPGDVLATTWFPAIHLRKNGVTFPIEVSQLGIATGAITNTGGVCWKPARPYYLLGPGEGVLGVIDRITGAVPVLGVACNLRLVFNRIAV